MRNYKHILMFEVGSSLLLNVTYALWRPVLLWPMRASIMTGILGNISPYSFFVMSGMTFFTIAAVATSQVIQFGYRVFVTYKHGFFGLDLISCSLWWIYGSMIGMLIVFCGFILGKSANFDGKSVKNRIVAPIFLNVIDPMEAQQMLVDDFPALQTLVDQYPYLTGYHPELTNYAITLIIRMAELFCATYPIGAIIAMFFFMWRLKLMKVNESSRTYAMHVMLLKALIVQYAIAFIFLLIPSLLIAVTIDTEVIWGSYVATLALLIATLHVGVNSICILWFILPYRIYVYTTLQHLLMAFESRSISPFPDQMA
uniref:Serpentine Receptor, class H n=1 Tax=Panagrellus redivivus TaxID=6233 RepID=A0A7E4VHG5_PANRE